MSSTARLLATGVERLVLTCEGTQVDLPAGVEAMAIPAENGHMQPAAILAGLAGRGFRRIMIERRPPCRAFSAPDLRPPASSSRR
jgi:hypothetical protein